MKYILFQILALFLYSGTVKSQAGCISSKVASPLVTQPTSASLVSSTCSTMVVQWQGSAGQTYTVTAERYNPVTKVIDTVAGINITCDASHNCSATIPVIPGTKVTWNVEAISIIDGSTYYSYPFVGTPVNYPILDCGVAPGTVSFSGKLYLQGAYNGTVMNNSLNMQGLLQANAATQPYNSGGFNYPGTESVGGGFYAAHPDIVDWVLVELRDSIIAPSIVTIRAAFVKQNGTLVDTDGTSTQISFLNMEPGNYYVSIRHRNHLSIISNSPVNFSTGTANYDFTSGPGQVYQNQAYSSTVLVGTNWAMRGGDANSNTESKYQGPGNDRASILTALSNNELTTVNGYYRSDINMDGLIRYQGPGNDRAFLLSSPLTNDELAVRRQQLR